MDIRDKYGADDERKWGTCSSPLIVDDKLIVNPGGKDASLGRARTEDRQGALEDHPEGRRRTDR